MHPGNLLTLRCRQVTASSFRASDTLISGEAVLGVRVPPSTVELSTVAGRQLGPSLAVGQGDQTEVLLRCTALHCTG